MYNPFEGLKPGFGPFKDVFSNWVGILLALLWAAALVYAAAHLVVGIAHIAKARRRNQVDGETTLSSVGWPVAALIGLTLVPVIYSAIVK